jgi:type IX secretion system PorP/SprF family membrane protein
MPDFGAGLYAYSTDKKWYAGLSAPQLLQQNIIFHKVTEVQDSLSSLSKIVTHLYATAGYKFTLSEDFKLEPNMCLKYVRPAPLQFDIGLRGIYQDKYWLCVAYRRLDAIAVMTGFVIKENFTVAYSYDISTTDIRKYSSGSSEISLAIKFHKIKPKESADAAK